MDPLPSDFVQSEREVVPHMITQEKILKMVPGNTQMYSENCISYSASRTQVWTGVTIYTRSHVDHVIMCSVLHCSTGQKQRHNKFMKHKKQRNHIYIRFELLTALKIHNVICCAMRWHSPVGEDQHCRAHRTLQTIQIKFSEFSKSQTVRDQAYNLS
jgi:hypothetical protein